MNFTKLCIPSAIVVMAEFAPFCANSVITLTLVAKFCEFHICKRFAQGKVWAISSFVLWSFNAAVITEIPCYNPFLNLKVYKTFEFLDAL